MVITYLEQIIQAIQNEEVIVSITKSLYASVKRNYETYDVNSHCIICEVSLRNCKGYIGVVYRSPSQDNVKFENFL